MMSGVPVTVNNKSGLIQTPVSTLGRGGQGAGLFIVPLGIEAHLAQAPAERGGDGPRTSRARFDAGRQAEPGAGRPT